MIDMAMGYQDSIEPIDLRSQSLLTEINRRIYENYLFIVLNENGDSEAFVSRIVGPACFAVAGERRNAGRSSSTEKGESHKSWKSRKSRKSRKPRKLGRPDP